MNDDGFVVGDCVFWDSQAGGFWKTKHGEVIEIVAPGHLPSRDRFPELYRSSGVGLARKHESYVVKVGTRHYWPRGAALQKR